MFVSITSPRGSGGTIPTVTRPITVTGTYNKTLIGGGILRSFWIDVQFGAGGPVVQATLTSSSTWSCTGSPPASGTGAVRGTDLFAISAVTKGFYDQPGDAAFGIPVDTMADSVTLRMADLLPPILAINPVPAGAPFVVNATTLPHPFTVVGSAIDQDSLITVIQGRVDAGPFTVIRNGGGGFSPTYMLGAGLHRITVQAIDAGGHVTSLELFVDVQPPPPGPTDPHSESITSWTRLEPHARDADLGMTVAARVFDPLWMLTRQWQVGEFQGVDAGSPVQARVRATTARLSRVRLDPASPNAQTVRYDPATMPLEALVERRRMRPADDHDTRQLGLAVEAGLHFLRLLDAQAMTKYRVPFVTRHVLAPLADDVAARVDDATRRFVQSMAGRALDARRLAAAIRPPAGTTQPVIDPALQVSSVDLPKVQKAAADWLAWYDALFSEPAGPTDAWNPSRMEYTVTASAAFSAQARDQVSVTATEYADARLDWSSFDVDPAADLGSAADGTFSAITETAIPAPLAFRGAPAVRFWELEDSQVAYGLVPVGPTDLAHMLLIEYAGSYGNDWFTAPLRVPVGSLTRVDSLVVTDTFGVRTLLRPIDNGAATTNRFAMWQQSVRRAPGPSGPAPIVPNVFLFPPGVGKAVEGAALEEVLLLRDEMANVAWAIERTIESPLEQPLAGAAATTPPPLAPATTRPPGALRYVLASTVPEHWVPLLPVRLPTASGREILRLQRGTLLQPDATSKPHVARGELLGLAGPLLLYDAEVPREGVRVTRGRRMARWLDGSTWVWNAFRKGVGRGEGSSALQFDRLDDPAGG